MLKCRVLYIAKYPESSPLKNRSPTITQPPQENVLNSEGTAAVSAAGGSKVLIVDDNRLDCPKAEYVTIQPALIAAEPGSTILVCAGTYVEWVVLENKNYLRLLDNGVADLFWDGTGAVEFENNHCGTSIPPGLCEHTEGAAHD